MIGFGTMCISYFVGIVVAGIFGGIFGAVYAFAYNVVSGWVGGLEVQMERTGTPGQNLPPMS